MTAAAGETMVRMGEYALATAAGDVLASIGLGSCIGLAVIDRSKRVAGLAHIMLPDSRESSAGTAAAAKFADRAVPLLVEKLVGRGALKTRLEAVLVGGAQMFSFGGGNLEIGRRNEEATRAALEKAGIPVRAAATGGAKGRTIRLYLDTVTVTFKEAGGAETAIYGAATARSAA
jgi:chemotaxis protein CheD